MVQSGKNWIRRLLGSKTFLFLMALALIAVAVNVGRESYRKYQLTQEIDKLKLEIERIEGKNEQLADLMEYLKQEPYLEKEARLKLNLKKPGEKVVVLPDQSESENDLVGSPVSNNSQTEESANYWEWWQYFFAP